MDRENYKGIFLCAYRSPADIYCFKVGGVVHMAQNALITVCPFCGKKLIKMYEGACEVQCTSCNTTLFCKCTKYGMTVEKKKEIS